MSEYADGLRLFRLQSLANKRNAEKPFLVFYRLFGASACYFRRNDGITPYVGITGMERMWKEAKYQFYGVLPASALNGCVKSQDTPSVMKIGLRI
jgi:hypothetical protein